MATDSVAESIWGLKDAILQLWVHENLAMAVSEQAPQLQQQQQQPCDPPEAGRLIPSAKT